MYYQIQIATDPQFENIVVNKIVENVTQYNVENDLEHFTVYYWRVQSVDPLNGNRSKWSTTCVFRVVGKDVTVTNNICNSYIVYGSNCFGLYHKFITGCDGECIIPDAIIGAGMYYPTSGVATIGDGFYTSTSGVATIGAGFYTSTSGVANIGASYCHGVVVPVWDGYTIEYLLTEDVCYLLTEDGIPIILEY